jgi:trehalose-phosphatase
MTQLDSPMSAELAAGIDSLSAAPVLLLATDFDGTIAGIVSEPSAAEADREALVALKALSAMPQTHVAIISGRALADLARRIAESGDVHLVGSHGSEFEAPSGKPLPPEKQALLNRLMESLAAIASATPGALVEAKPASVAFHFRNAEEHQAAAAIEKLLQEPATWPGVHVRHGKKVIELGVVETDKGRALERLRQRLGASAVLFVGDDTTDEDAFATLRGPDIGVKVGPGESRAAFRADGPIEVTRILARVAERRADWLAGSHATPIEKHAMLSDQRTAALVDSAGRIVWLCLPRIDSPATFAELLGGPAAGVFAVGPADGSATTSQAYEGDTFILRSRWAGISVVDYLDCGGGRAFQRAGRTDLVRVIEGRGAIRIVFSPRLDFGRVGTTLRISEAGVEVEGLVDSLVLRAPQLPWRIVAEGPHQTAVAEFELTQSPLVLELRYGTASLEADALPENVRRERTARFWSGWAGSLQLPRTAREAVLRSALVLKGLSYGPTGAIAAAATTSLPEHAGGVRNWDYRYCWPRDAAMAALSLSRLGSTGPALRLLDWVLGILDHAQPGTMLCPVYTVTGAHLMPEAEIAQLAGYRGSRPVRVGNAAAHQIQLDVCGPITELIDSLARHGAALSAEHWRLVENMVEAVSRRWTEPDHGIWEVRRPRRHHVHSKVMCWQTVDRGLRIARYVGRHRPDWEALRGAIRDEVMTRGLRADGAGFAATYDEDEPDAAVLALGLSGMVEAGNPRFAATLDEIQRRLRCGPTVYRYRYDDGLPGEEGGFGLCTTWLIQSLIAVGRRDEAEELFGEFLGLAGATGLLSEEYDPKAGVALGNYPQAYSHLGLIDAAVALENGDRLPLR